MTTPAKLKQIIEELEAIDDPLLKSELLIEYSEKFQSVPESIAKEPFPESNKVPGCESEVYVFSEKTPNHTLNFYFGIMNPQGISAKAMAAIIDETISGAPLEDVASIDDDIVLKIFGSGLTMGKGIGLKSMLGVIRTLAKVELNERRKE